MHPDRRRSQSNTGRHRPTTDRPTTARPTDRQSPRRAPTRAIERGQRSASSVGRASLHRQLGRWAGGRRGGTGAHRAMGKPQV
jgi:hypothetical protein